MNTYTDQIFTALSVSKRREIVELIAQKGQMSSTNISDQFQITSAAISQHLKVLRDAKILVMEKKAQQRLYDLNPDSLDEVSKWSMKLKETWNSRFTQLDKLLLKGNL